MNLDLDSSKEDELKPVMKWLSIYKISVIFSTALFLVFFSLFFIYTDRFILLPIEQFLLIILLLFVILGISHLPNKKIYNLFFNHWVNYKIHEKPKDYLIYSITSLVSLIMFMSAISSSDTERRSFFLWANMIFLAAIFIILFIGKKVIEKKREGFDYRYFKGEPSDVVYPISEALSYLNLKSVYSVEKEKFSGVDEFVFTINNTDLVISGYVVLNEGILVKIGKINPMNVRVAYRIEKQIADEYNITRI